jgi:glucose/arabinose dehydrogenase
MSHRIGDAHRPADRPLWLGSVKSNIGHLKAALEDIETLSAIQANILTGKDGFQEIRGDIYFSPPDSRTKIILPRSFTFLGQRFVLDSWVLSKVVYDDMPSYAAHGWKYIAVDKDGWFFLPFGPPFNIGIPPTSVSQIRRVDPKTGNAETWALGVRNSVGGDVDPRTGKYWFTENARDWISDDLPSDKLNMISKIGEHFGYPYCHQGDLPDPKFAMGHKCSEFSPPVLNLGAHVAPLGMKFYTGNQFPAEYKNNIFIAEHGSWNRHKYQGARIKRVIVGPDGKNAKQEIFASGWLEGDQGYLGRPADIILDKDGALLIADDWAGAIYRISYSKK